MHEAKSGFAPEPPEARKAKLIAVGNSTGVILPKMLLDRLGVGQGDELSVTEAPDGVVLRIPDQEFDRQMEVAREVMRRHRHALRELAK
ncbi:MAG: AbrB/MazE/SpoVT family DNA-binding domain-containing protein [Sphingomonadales bacterium]|nr:AbrB/MazE/SpoVT family DNA-binding domain-containing protein [Sphingomonadales bacterium]